MSSREHMSYIGLNMKDWQPGYRKQNMKSQCRPRRGLEELITLVLCFK